MPGLLEALGAFGKVLPVGLEPRGPGLVPRSWDLTAQREALRPRRLGSCTVGFPWGACGGAWAFPRLLVLVGWGGVRPAPRFFLIPSPGGVEGAGGTVHSVGRR